MKSQQLKRFRQALMRAQKEESITTTCFLTSLPSAAAYRSILNETAACGGYFGLVFRNLFGVSISLETAAKAVNSSPTTIVETKWWPGTHLCDNNASIVLFSANESTINKLVNFGSILDLRYPNHLEDLSIWSSNYQWAVGSTAHENMVFLNENEKSGHLHNDISKILREHHIELISKPYSIV